MNKLAAITKTKTKMSRKSFDEQINDFKNRLNSVFGYECDGIINFNDFFDTYELYRSVETTNNREVFNDEEKYHCRFCDKDKEAGATFINTPHIISQLFGKPNLTSTYECDECNSLFGKYESDLGNWSLPERAILGQRTKKGKRANYQRSGVSLQNKKESEILEDIPQNLREAIKDETVIYYKANTPKPEDEQEDDTIKIELKIPGYTPINVYKSLVKIALSIIHQKDLEDLKATLKWIRIKDEVIPPKNSCLIFVFRYKQIIEFVDYPVIWLFRRKKAIIEEEHYCPTWNFVMFTGNMIYQIFLPFSKSDIESMRKVKKMRTIIYPAILNPKNLICTCEDNFCITSLDSVLLNYADFGGIEKIKNGTKSMTFKSKKK